MDHQKKLEDLSSQNRLQLTTNDRLFFSKYLYRLTIELYSYRYPDLMYIKTVDHNAFTVDTGLEINFLNAIRNYAYKNSERVRLEYKNVMYYTSDIKRLETVISYVKRLKQKETGTDDERLLELTEIKYFPGGETDYNIRFRKSRLPYGKFKYQILGERMELEEYESWEKWALQYPDDIKLPQGKYLKHWGVWSGEAIGYVTNDKMLQLINFKLGSKINKIIEFQLRG